MAAKCSGARTSASSEFGERGGFGYNTRIPLKDFAPGIHARVQRAAAEQLPAWFVKSSSE
jgi:hypothetical protein